MVQLKVVLWVLGQVLVKAEEWANYNENSGKRHHKNVPGDT
jgi:hypothetical protein